MGFIDLQCPHHGAVNVTRTSFEGSYQEVHEQAIPKTRLATNHYDFVEVVNIEDSDGRWRRRFDFSLDTSLLGYATGE